MSRIWLDLSSFFSCCQKHSCVFVDHDVYPTVKDVQEKISRLFCLNKKFHILNDGWLLPASENSRLLRDNDTCSVVPEDGPTFCDPQPPLREVGIIVEQDDDDDGSATESKKRKRIRGKKKSAPSAPEAGQKLSENLSLRNNVANTLSRAGDVAATISSVDAKDTKKRKHIFVDEPDVSKLHKVHLSEEPAEQRLPHNNYRDESKTPSARSSPAREGVVSNLNREGVVLNLNEKPKETGAETNVSEIIKTITPLTGFPVKGAIIQFKVLKIVNWAPVVSKMIKANVLFADEATKQVFVRIKENLSELQCVQMNKLILDTEESLNMPLGEYLTLDWEQLIEPKVVG